MDLQALPGSAVINLSDNQGMCGGIPRPLANKLSLSREVDSFTTPCLNSPVSFSLAGADSVVLKLSSQVRSRCTPLLQMCPSQCTGCKSCLHYYCVWHWGAARLLCSGWRSTWFGHQCNVTFTQQYIELRG